MLTVRAVELFINYLCIRWFEAFSMEDVVTERAFKMRDSQPNVLPTVTTNFLNRSIKGGCSPKKNQKKPVATPKLANWHWFFLVFFGFFWFFKISKLALVFFGFFLVFFGFFGIGFGQNSKLETGFFWFFFGFFWFFLVFFGLSFGQHSKLETGFWVFLVFFGFSWFFLGFFGFFGI